MKNIIALVRSLLFFDRKVRTELMTLLLLMIITSASEALMVIFVAKFVFGLELNKSATSDGYYLNAAIFLASTICSGVFRLLTIRKNTLVAARITSEISNKIYKYILNAPLADLRIQPSSLYMSLTGVKVECYGSSINNLLIIVSSSLSAGAIMVALIISQAQAVAVISPLLLMVYAGTALYFSKLLTANSHVISISKTRQVSFISDAFGLAREIRLTGLSSIFEDKYRSNELNIRYRIATNAFASQCPRYILETVVFSLVAVAGIFLTKPGSVGLLFPALAAFAVAAQRLLPSLQGAYSGWATINSYSEQNREIINAIQRFIGIQSMSDALEDEITAEMHLDGPRASILGLKDATFTYPNSSKAIFEKLSISLESGSWTFIQGASGSGKSTLLDILTGLVPLTSGKLIHDGQLVITRSDHRNLQASIGYVPQMIYLMNGSILENLVPATSICTSDINKVTIALERAGLLGFVRSHPEGLNMSIGDNGCNLSGGQRQRLAIARALLTEPEIIIFDESFSGLDTPTKDLISVSLKSESYKPTVLITSHNNYDKKYCDDSVSL